jgi:5-methylcytosine-specific restriction endonuclease McrA
VGKKKSVKKVPVAKPRNSGTMTESAFWSFIRSALRQKSRWWKPISECKSLAKRPYKGPNKRQTFEYKCSECNKWHPDKNIAIDHIKPAGKLNCAEDLPLFVTKLFCEIDNLQVLCEQCHLVKTALDKESIKQSKLIENGKTD